MIPYDRAEIAVATLNGKVYVISGQSRGVDANEFTQEYDPATGTWRELALMPAVASHAGAVALNGKIYVVGGFLASVHVGAMDRVFEYDPATDMWKALAPLPAPRGAVGLVVLDGKIHAIGGRDPQLRTVSTHEVYDPGIQQMDGCGLAADSARSPRHRRRRRKDSRVRRQAGPDAGAERAP